MVSLGLPAAGRVEGRRCAKPGDLGQHTAWLGRGTSSPMHLKLLVLDAPEIALSHLQCNQGTRQEKNIPAFSRAVMLHTHGILSVWLKYPAPGGIR